VLEVAGEMLETVRGPVRVVRNLLDMPSAVWTGNQWIDEPGIEHPAAGPEGITQCPRRVGLVSQGLITSKSPVVEYLQDLTYECVIVDEAHRASICSCDGAGSTKAVSSSHNISIPSGGWPTSFPRSFCRSPSASTLAVSALVNWRQGCSPPKTREELKQRVRRGDIRLLLAADAASEGLNLQTLGTLINHDLPWNPTRLEQRKGRMQRIGQLRDKVFEVAPPQPSEDAQRLKRHAGVYRFVFPGFPVAFNYFT
jgi:hypothetical protein